MDENFDREKIVDCMFDPITSSILAELEDGQKQCSFLAQQNSISESEVLERLSYLIEHKFVFKNSDNGCTVFLLILKNFLASLKMVEILMMLLMVLKNWILI